MPKPGSLVAPDDLTKDQLYALCLSLLTDLGTAGEALRRVDDAFEDRMRTAQRTLDEKDANRVGEDERKRAKSELMNLRYIRGEVNKWCGEHGVRGLGWRLKDLAERKGKDLRHLAAKEWQRLQDFLEVTGKELEWSDPDSTEDHLMNESRLYEALGKDDARTVLGVWRRFLDCMAARAKVGYVNRPEGETVELLSRFGGTHLFGRMLRLIDFADGMVEQLRNPDKRDEHFERRLMNYRRLHDQWTKEMREAGSLLHGLALKAKAKEKS